MAPASPTVRRLFALADEKKIPIKEICRQGQWCHSHVKGWKTGLNQPSILNVEVLAAIVGTEVRV